MTGELDKHNYDTVEDRSKLGHHGSKKVKADWGGSVGSHRKASYRHGMGVGNRSHMAGTM